MTDVLPDLLRPNLKVVFCGTAPSKKSAKERAYYAHERNRFWRILHEAGITGRQFMPSEYKDLEAFGIGFTDLCKSDSGNDDQLPPRSFDPMRLRAAIRTHSPRFLALTSGFAGRILCGDAAYGPTASIGETRIWILPTTSPRRGEVWWIGKKDYWHAFGNEVHTLCPP
jgi:TDG/mug DNA glycosylase family protein